MNCTAEGRTELQCVNELHVFRHKQSFLAFHPETYSLFRVGGTLATILKDLKTCGDLDAVALRHGIVPAELSSKLSAIKARVDSNQSSIDARPVEDEPSRTRPVHLTLHVSNACNLDCVYCYAQGGDYGRETRTRMDKGLALKAIDTMYRNFPNIDGIMFFGGEPTLAMDVIEAVCKHIQEKEGRGEIAQLPVYSMVTNGTLLDDEAIRIIKENKIGLTISVDGPKELNDRLRPHKGGQGSYDLIKKGFDKVVKETGVIPGVEATYTQAHQDAGLSMSGLVDFLHKEFHFSVGTIAHVDLPDNNPLALAIDDTTHEIDETTNNLVQAMARGEQPKMERSLLRPVLQFVKKSGTRFTCSIGYDGFDITTEGDVYPCQVFINQEDFLMGTVHDFDIDNPSPQLKRAMRRLIYRDKYTNPICSKCWAKEFCFTCPGSDIFRTNDYQVPESFCTRVRGWMERVLGLLYDLKRDPVLWSNFLKAIETLSNEMEQQLPGMAARENKPSLVPLPPPGPAKPKLYQIQGVQ